MSKIGEMIKDSGRTSLFFSLLLLIPISLASLCISPPDIVFNIWPWATSFFSLGHSFFGGLAVSLISMFLMLCTFDFIKSLGSMLKVDYNAINGKRALLISSLLLFIFFIIWISSFSGMLYSTFPLGDDMYAIRHIGVLSSAIPIPVFSYSIFLKICNETVNSEAINKNSMADPLALTVIFTIVLVVFYAKSV